jgi:hypothetical protein
LGFRFVEMGIEMASDGMIWIGFVIRVSRAEKREFGGLAFSCGNGFVEGHDGLNITTDF